MIPYHEYDFDKSILYLAYTDDDERSDEESECPVGNIKSSDGGSGKGSIVGSFHGTLGDRFHDGSTKPGSHFSGRHG